MWKTVMINRASLGPQMAVLTGELRAERANRHPQSMVVPGRPNLCPLPNGGSSAIRVPPLGRLDPQVLSP